MVHEIVRIAAADNVSKVFVEAESEGSLRAVERFVNQVAQAFEAWVSRRDSKNTQATYRRHVMAFVEFLGIRPVPVHRCYEFPRFSAVDPALDCAYRKTRIDLSTLSAAPTTGKS